MNLELNNITYSQRAKSFLQEVLLRIRAKFYENKIINSIFISLSERKIEWKALDLWWWKWHKTEVLIRNIIWESWIIHYVEPCDAMIEWAKERLKWYKNVVINKWSSLDLTNYQWLDAIFCNQMTHHLDSFSKKQLFEDAFLSLNSGGKIFILDTTLPNNVFLWTIFTWLINFYKKIFWKDNNYFNISTQEYINLLQEAWFEIDIDNTQHFYIMWKLWEIGTKMWLLYPFMTQIIAIKK